MVEEEASGAGPRSLQPVNRRPLSTVPMGMYRSSLSFYYANLRKTNLRNGTQTLGPCRQPQLTSTWPGDAGLPAGWPLTLSRVQTYVAWGRGGCQQVPHYKEVKVPDFHELSGPQRLTH